MFWRADIGPDAESFKVLLKRGEFVDEARDGRVVPFKIYYPTDHSLDKMPVVLWSHGFGGNRDGASFISRFVAAYGYALLHMTHEGTDSSLWEGKPGHPWDILKKVKVPREVTLNRMFDVSFVLDQLPGWAEENPDIGVHMDLGNVGMSGHSFGALTTQVMAGQLVPNVNDELTSYKEERIRAGILYSPIPIRHLSDAPDEQVYGSIDIPLFHMTGTEDDSPIEGFDYTRRLIVHEHSGHENKHLMVLKDGDHMVYNGTRGKLGKNPNREKHEDIIKISSLAFWDAYLKGDAAAKEWLDGEGMKAYIDQHG
ncbi:MAG: hypothetical protein DHS20C02_19930 [Micavibrio sp.]|nr:MAG: hypothetical protein DHS20C02_19930 [Micavibrio sp.]